VRRFVLRGAPLAVLLATFTLPVLPAQAGATTTVSTFAGSGVGDGANALQAALGATGAAVGPDGTYVADASHNRVRLVTSGGAISTVAGTGDLVDGKGGFSGDGGPATGAKLFNPTQVQVTGGGDLIVLDTGNHRIRRVAHDTGAISTIAGSGAGCCSTGGAATSQAINPVDIAQDPNSTAIAIADTANSTVWQLETGNLTPLVTTVGTPAAVAYDGSFLLIADPVAGEVKVLDFGTLTTLVSGLPGVSSLAVAPNRTIYAGTPAGVKSFSIAAPTPVAVAGAPCTDVATVDATNRLLVSCKALWVRQGASFVKVAGNHASEVGVDVSASGLAATSAPFAPTGGLATSGTDTYVTNALTVDRVSGGAVTRVAGTDGPAPAVADGSAALSTPLTSPTAVVAGPGGSLFVVDAGSIKRIDGSGNLSAYSGTSPTATVTEGEPAASLPPVGPIVLAPSGDLYAATGETVVSISSADGTVHVVAASLKALGGRTSSSTTYETARALSVAPDGTLLVLSDEGSTDPNNTEVNSRIRRLDVGTGAFTQLSYGPRLLALTSASDGTVYVAAPRLPGAVVEQLDSAGGTSIIAGLGHGTGTAQAGSALYLPDVNGLGIAPDGGVLIASAGARRVLEIAPGFVSSTPAPVTNMQSSFNAHDGIVDTTFTWDLPPGIPASSHIELNKALGPVTLPLGRLDPNVYAPSTDTYIQVGEIPGRQYTITVYVVNAAGEQSGGTSLSVVPPGDSTPPSVPVVGAGFSLDGTFRLDWTESGSADLKATELRIGPGLSTPDINGAPAYEGLAETAKVTGLVVGQTYTATLTSRDFSGNAATAAPVHFIAGSTPHAVLSSGPAEGTFTGPATTFTPSFGESFSGTPHCLLDGGEIPCTVGTPLALAGLANGSHTLAYHLSNRFGNGPVASRLWKVDATVPAVGVKALAPFTVAPSFTVSWAGADTGSGLDYFRVRYRRASFTGAWSAFAQPAAIQHLTTRTTVINLPAGYTYCAQVQAVDKVGNTSAWSTEKCTTRPLDDRALVTTSSGWTRGTSSLYFGKTFTATKTHAASIARTKATFRQLAVLVSTCRTCGSISVYSGTTLIKTVSLVSATTKRQVLIVLPVVTTRTATVYLRVTSATGRNVEIDGLGIARA
jgi:hypothetical protein